MLPWGMRWISTTPWTAPVASIPARPPWRQAWLSRSCKVGRQGVTWCSRWSWGSTTRGRVGIGEIAQTDDAQVLALSKRVQGKIREDAPEGWAQVYVRRVDGRAASLETTSPSGSPEKPLSDAQLEAKFRDCAAHSVRPIPQEVVERAFTRLAEPEGGSSRS